MKTIAFAALFLLCATGAACSSSTEKTPEPGTSGSTGTPAPEPTTDPPADTTSGGEPAPAVVKAPTIDKIMKMQGALHVSWTNAEPACDAIEGERQAQQSDGTIMEKYKVAFSVPGEADNKHDVGATAAMKYTYRLRCKKGTTYSAYSNEMSGSPK